MSKLIERALHVRHPEDVKALKEQIPMLQKYSDFEVQEIYSNWCESTWSSAWLGISSAYEFYEALEEE